MKVYQEYHKLFRLTCGQIWQWKDKVVYYNLLKILSHITFPQQRLILPLILIWLIKYQILYFVSKLFKAIITICLVASLTDDLLPKELLSNKDLGDPGDESFEELFERFADMKGIMPCLVQFFSWHYPLAHAESLPHEERKAYAEKVHSCWYQNLYNNLL